MFVTVVCNCGSEVDWSRYKRLRNQVSNRVKIEKRRHQRNVISNNMADPKILLENNEKYFSREQEENHNSSVYQN